jgi:nucleotide-binding universal stress UspA family protein
MKTILLATDGSPSATKATDVAIELAGALDASLHIVSVWQLPTYDYGYVPLQYAPELMEEQRKQASVVLERAIAAATEAGIDASPDLRQGAAAAEICTAAEEAAADMIVVGAHGWGAVKRLLFGSVSSAVLHHALSPVLVVRGDPDERTPEAVGAASAHSHS